jgi:hypothetical protein
MRTQAKMFVALVAAVAVLVPFGSASAATNPNFTQVINAGTQSVDIVDGTGASVSNPSVAFGAVNFSFDCQDATATLGASTGTVRKIAVKNPKKAGIKVDLNSTTPATDKWTSGGNNYDFNDATADAATSTAGCANGQLTVGAGTFTKTLGAGTPTQSTPGGAFSSVAPVTLLNSTGTTSYEAELTDYALTQKIPAEQADGNYSLPMNITFTQQ